MEGGDPFGLDGRTFWQQLYALVTLQLDQRYAGVAEAETAMLLDLMAAEGKGHLVNLRPGKRENEHGFDGVFAGAIPMLGIGSSEQELRLAGIEVKTSVQEDLSLLGGMTAAKEGDGRRGYILCSLRASARRILDSVRQRADVPLSGEQQGWLLKPPSAKEIRKTLSSAQLPGRRFSRAAPSTGDLFDIHTVLVARVLTARSEIQLSDKARVISDELFGHVLVFNLFGELVRGATRSEIGSLDVSGIDRLAFEHMRTRGRVWAKATGIRLPASLRADLDAAMLAE